LVLFIKKTAKRKAGEFLLQPKKMWVYVLKKTYFFFAVFFFAAAFFLTAIIYSPPFFILTSMRNIFSLLNFIH